MTATKKENSLKQAMERAKSARRLMVIEMPEECDTAPHWLVWIALISFVGLAASIIWQMTNATSNIQAFLPFL